MKLLLNLQNYMRAMTLNSEFTLWQLLMSHIPRGSYGKGRQRCSLSYRLLRGKTGKGLSTRWQIQDTHCMNATGTYSPQTFVLHCCHSVRMQRRISVTVCIATKNVWMPRPDYLGSCQLIRENL